MREIIATLPARWQRSFMRQKWADLPFRTQVEHQAEWQRRVEYRWQQHQAIATTSEERKLNLMRQHLKHLEAERDNLHEDSIDEVWPSWAEFQQMTEAEEGAIECGGEGFLCGLWPG